MKGILYVSRKKKIAIAVTATVASKTNRERTSLASTQVTSFARYFPIGEASSIFLHSRSGIDATVR